MNIKSKQLFIIIGNDNTGKTTLQKLIIAKLTDFDYERLPANKLLDLVHPEIKRKFLNISFANRSYQEKINEYKSVDNYFKNYFQQADIAFISSHLSTIDIQQMITNGRKCFYNVNGIFWTNSIENNRSLNEQISLLDWNERFVITNPLSENEETIYKQLEKISDSIIALLINRTGIS